MRITIFGGTGNLGKIITKKLLDKNQNVCVLSRQQLRSNGHVQYVTGNVLDIEAVKRCINEGDQVVVSLGFNNSDIDTMSRGTSNVVKAMKEKNCKRLICVSAQGAGDSWDYMPSEFKEMVLSDSILKASFTDHSLQEKSVMQPEFEWTIVRLTEIIDIEETKNYSINKITPNSAFKISKYDVAAFIVKELFEKKYSRQVAMITN